jgi:beta-galactosidase
MKSRSRLLAVAASLVLGVCTAALPVVPAMAQATRYANQPPLLLGVSWYPEHWPESRWETDLALMEKANVRLVRIAEFSWSTMEPQEGRYDFGWLDLAIAAAARHHIAVVLGTPTAAPPAWLTQKYPEVLRVAEDGRPAEHGGRQQFSFASAKYRQLARGIAEAMAVRYGHNPDVVGWQIDNEIGLPSYDEETRAAWHRWLAGKYRTLGELNARWTTAYWSQTYDRFDEVPLHSSDQNPGLLLDFKHFATDTWLGYVDSQVRAIRPHVDARQFITTNTQHWNASFDHYTLHQDLDLAAWDDYITDGKFEWADNAVQHDLVRGYKNKNFWVMETQPVFVNWVDFNGPLKPGQMREMAWQAVGHGADAVAYWQWRSALNGQEQYFGTVVGPDGEPVPGFDEIARIGAEFAAAGPALAGTSPRSQVALLHSYDSRWALEFQRHNKAFDPIEEFTSFYRPIRARAQSADVISPDAPLSSYKLVVAPALNVITDSQARALDAYVRGGGNLVLGPRSGMKDAFNALQPQRQPGPLQGLLGGRVEQFYALGDRAALKGELGDGAAKVWGEQLTVRAPDTRILMRYGKANGWLDGQPAIITRKVGQGSITYVGAWLDDSTMARLADWLVKDAAVTRVIPDAPDDVEVCERVGQGRRVIVLINHAADPRTVRLPRRMRAVLGATGEVDRVDIPAYGVAVVQTPAAA